MHILSVLKIVRLIIGSVCLLWPAALLAQHEVTTYYDRAKTVVKETFHTAASNPAVLEGAYTNYYANGQAKIKGYYNNNIATGFWEYFYENGHSKMRGILQNSVYDGLWEYFYENGHLQMQGAVYDTTRSGHWQFFYESGTLKSEGSFEEGKKDGLWKYYYEDKKLKAEEQYQGDTSTYREYYVSGELKLQGVQVKGINEGKWIRYYENSIVDAEGTYASGRRQGQWRFYYPNGELSSTGDFMDDSSVGKWTYYYRNGSISAEGAEKNGLKEGYWKLYQSNGDFKGEAVFNSGEGVYKEFYEGGKLKVKGRMHNSVHQGKWQYFYEDGVLEGDAVFKNGTGTYYGYYRDGTLKMKGAIENGGRTGVWQLYKPDGTLAGYYTSVYENNEAVFKALDKVTATSDSASGSNRTAALNAEYLYRKKTSRYFQPRVNELTSVIIGINPLALIFNRLPISVEYYMQERLGYELEVGIERKPFFVRSKNIASDKAYQRGFYVAFKQKFYHTDTRSGMFYFGHSIGFDYINHVAKVSMQDGQMTSMARKILVREKRISYGVMGGTRLMKDADIINTRVAKDVRSRGLTFDLFGGVGVGYRFGHKSYTGDQYDHILGSKKRNSLFFPWQIGATVGYVF